MSEARNVVPDPELLARYGCGPIRFSGHNDALYERHLLFDDVVAPDAAGPRERFEAAARSVRDVLSQRWMLTESTYDRENPKRIYYLSMEFLIGRSLSNNITNLLLDPFAKGMAAAEEPRLARPHRTGTRCRAWERRARAPGGLLSRLDGDDAAAGDGLRAALRIRHVQTVHPKTAGSTKSRTTGCAARTRGRSRARTRRSKSELELLVRDAGRAFAPRRRAALYADRHPVRSAGVGYGGKTINTLRLWAAAAPDYFDFQEFSSGDFVGALAGTLAAESLTRVLYPDDSTEHGAGTALRAGVFSRRLLAGRSRAALPPQQCRLEHLSRQGRDPAQRYASDDGGAGVDADPAR